MSAASKAIRPDIPQDDPWMTVKDAADQLGISRHLLLMRAAKGEIETREVAKRLVVSRASVERARGEG